jgi:predicted kinase
MDISKNKPALLLVAGLPASGKTWFARALAEKLNAVHINSDTVRTEMGLRGRYGPGDKQRVYDAMFERGTAALKNGRFVIVDSTFFKKKLRQPWFDLAEKCGVPCHFIEIKIPEAVAFQRLQKKREDSEADREVYLKLKDAWESIEKTHLTLDSNQLSIVEMVDQAEKYLTENS